MPLRPSMFNRLPNKVIITVRSMDVRRKRVEDGNDPTGWLTGQSSYTGYLKPINPDVQTQWDGPPGWPQSNWNYVNDDWDEADPFYDGANPDWVQANSDYDPTGPVDIYNVDTLSPFYDSDIIDEVKLRAWAFATATGWIYWGLNIGGSPYWAPEYFHAGNDEEMKEHVYSTNPATGQPWTKAAIDALKLTINFNGTIPAAQRVGMIQLRVKWTPGWFTATGTDGRIRIERAAAGSEDHIIMKAVSSENWSNYTHLRFKIQKVTYAGAVGLKVGLLNGSTWRNVNVADYCPFASTTEGIICLIPLADFPSADLTDIDGVGFTADGDGGDYDFYIDDLEAVELDDENNDKYYTTIDTDVKGYAQVATGIDIQVQGGEVTEKGAAFYLPKGTEIDRNDHLVYNDEEFRVVGINDSYPTHILVDAVLVEVWE